MERKVTKLEHSHVEVIVTVDEASWKAAQEKSFKKIAGTIEIPGFRKGKAPENLIKSKVDQVKVLDDAINSLLPVLYKDVLDNENIKPITQPTVDVTKISDKELEVKFLIVTIPEIKLGTYKGLKVGKKEISVSDKEIDFEVENLRKQNATLVVKDGEAALGDIVVIDFVGKLDGVEFEGGKAENHELELGSGSFIPGFEDQLVGVKAGDTKVINVTFPENYVENLKGKPATFDIAIHEVKEKKVPELNADFIKDLNLPKVSTIEELKDFKKNEIKSKKERQEKREYLNKLFEEIAKTSTIDIPNEIIDDQVASRKKDIEGRLSQSGLTLDDYLKNTNTDPAKFEASLKEESIKSSTQFLISQEIAKVENVEVGEADIEFELAKIAEQYNMKIEDVKKALANQLDEFAHNLKLDRVEQILLQNND